MKLGKEEIQKIILGILLATGVVYGYFEWLLDPLKARHAATAKSIAALDPEIARAKAQIARDTEVKKQGPIAQETMARIDGMIPDGAPVAWFPTAMTEFFKGQGIDKANTRMTGEAAYPNLPDYRQIHWTVELPKVECLRFSRAIAALENDEPLITVDGMSIEALRDEPDAQRVVLSITNTVKK